MITANGILLFILFFIISSCRYDYSPYTNDTPKIEQNILNLLRLLNQTNASGTRLRVALLSDTHNAYSVLDDALKDINNKGPFDFVLIAGDITNLGLLDEFKIANRYFSKLKYPYLVVPGNHDLISQGTRIFKKFFGPDQYSFMYAGTLFLLHNNNNWEQSHSLPDLDWLEGELNKRPASFIVTLAHVPPNDNARFDQTVIKRWEQLVATFQINYNFNGHNHGPSAQELGTHTNVTIGSMSNRVYVILINDGAVLSHEYVRF